MEKLIGKSLGPSRYDINEAMRKLLEDNPPGNFDDQSDVEISLDTLRDEVSDEKEEQGYSIKNTYKVKNIIISKSALSAHLILEENISSYCKQAMVNNLPDGFHSLYRLSSIFRNASNIDVQNSSNGNEAQAQINSDLMKEVKELRDALEALKDTKRRNPFFDSLQTQAGKSLADWKMWGAILSASVVMAGGGLLLDYLTDIAESLEELRQKQAAPK